jgi:hypothetical protein
LELTASGVGPIRPAERILARRRVVTIPAERFFSEFTDPAIDVFPPAVLMVGGARRRPAGDETTETPRCNTESNSPTT